jgi:hypothetical protein
VSCGRHRRLAHDLIATASCRESLTSSARRARGKRSSARLGNGGEGTEKRRALVGVAISVTTIPAAAYLGVAIGIGELGTALHPVGGRAGTGRPSRPFSNPDAAPSPFAMQEYRLVALKESESEEAGANTAAEQAREDIDRADRYVLAVVLFATCLFFAGVSTRLRTSAGQASSSPSDAHSLSEPLSGSPRSVTVAV